MFVLRLGVISTLLSEALISGFTTGAGVGVVTSQVKDLFGIKLTPVNGNFEIILVINRYNSRNCIHTLTLLILFDDTELV